MKQIIRSGTGELSSGRFIVRGSLTLIINYLKLLINRKFSLP